MTGACILRAVSSGKEKLVCRPHRRRAAVVDFIRSAQHSLILTMFRCDDLGIIQELGEAVRRNVRVEVLITSRAKGWSKRLGPLAGCLECMGVRVHRLPPESLKYHAKYMVADGLTALISTQNLTRKCFRNTRDFVVITQDSSIVFDLEKMFRSDVSGRSGELPLLSERLIIGPDISRAAFEKLLLSARHSIHVIDHKLSDERTLAILARCSERGVSVSVDAGHQWPQWAAHGRAVLIDGQKAIVGSFSLTEKSLTARRELAIVLNDAGLVSKLRKYFQESPGIVANRFRQAA